MILGRAGVACLVAEALPDVYLTTPSAAAAGLTVPSTEVQFDMRGRVEVLEGERVCVDLAEVKTSVDNSGEGVSQLHERLAVVRFVLEQLLAPELAAKGFRLTGRLLFRDSADEVRRVSTTGLMRSKGLEGIFRLDMASVL